MAPKLSLFIPHSQIANQTDEKLLCDQLTAKLSLFMPYFQVAYQTDQF